MALHWPFKDPAEDLDYEIDWSARLGEDEIASAVISISVGSVVIGVTSTTPTTSTVWLSGGALGETCDIFTIITTVGGRVMDQNVRLKIKTRN